MVEPDTARCFRSRESRKGESPITVTPSSYADEVIGLAEVRELDAVSAAVADAFEPAAVPLPDAVTMWDLVDAVERRVAAMKTLLAPRVEESRAWKRAGHRNAAEFLAERAGTSIATARTQLEVAQKLEQLPALQRAVREGEYSAQQVVLVSRARAQIRPPSSGCWSRRRGDR